VEELIGIYMNLIQRLAQIGLQDIQEGNVADDPALQLEQSINELTAELESQNSTLH
jgi:hypothetical protein